MKIEHQPVLDARTSRDTAFICQRKNLVDICRPDQSMGGGSLFIIVLFYSYKCIVDGIAGSGSLIKSSINLWRGRGGGWGVRVTIQKFIGRWPIMANCCAIFITYPSKTWLLHCLFRQLLIFSIFNSTRSPIWLGLRGNAETHPRAKCDADGINYVSRNPHYKEIYIGTDPWF